MAVGLVRSELPDSWFDLYRHFANNVSGMPVKKLARKDALLFTDTIPPDGFGTGFFYNTPASVSQLVVALAVAPNPEIRELASNSMLFPSLASLAKAMRVKKVLKNFKLLDLGCGIVPGFAMVAKTLGAEVHTVDGESLGSGQAKLVDTHTVVDLCSPEAIPAIKANTGGQFDFISECIIGSVPGHPSWKTPLKDDLYLYGEHLLKPSGFQHHAGYVHVLQKT